MPAEARQTLEIGDIYRAHGATVERWVQRLTGPGADVEDLVQDIFIRASDHLSGFRGECQLTTWLYRITQTVVLNHRRREKWRRLLTGLVDSGAGELPSPAPGPHETLEQLEAARRLYQVLDGLSEKDRTLIILFEVEHLSGEEVAEMTGMKVGTVWVNLHRARQRFLKRIEGLGWSTPEPDIKRGPMAPVMAERS